MKKMLALFVLFIITVQISFAQKKTSIRGIIENAQDTISNIEIAIFDGQFAKTEMQNYQVVTTNGIFQFDFELKRTAQVGIYINNRLASLPGSFSILVNPGDNIAITIHDVKKMGLQNISFSGKGSDKINLLKAINRRLLASNTQKARWDKSSITEKYLNADKYLNIIDSMFIKNGLKNIRDLKLVRAQVTDGALDMLLYHSVKHYSDSVAILFEKYIKRKNRVTAFLNKEVINYYGGRHILPNYILLANRDKIQGESHVLRFTQPVDFSKLVIKEFNQVPAVRDFLLSYFAKDFFRNKWDSPISKELFSFYSKNVDHKNPYFKEVLQTFEYAQNNLKKGDPFYNFNLPDTAGKRYHLTDFKEKVVILDFWFNGCFACKLLVPSINKAEEFFKNKAVQFISIGIDKKEPWKQGIGIFSSESSLQLYTEEKRMDHDIVKFAKVSSYPRLIVLDKQGNIVGIPPNPATDFEGFASYINELL